MLLSFGLVPSILLIRYLVGECKAAKETYYKTRDFTRIALLVGIGIAVLIHGVVDYTIFWVQTAPLFFLLVASASAKDDRINKIT